MFSPRSIRVWKPRLHFRLRVSLSLCIQNNQLEQSSDGTVNGATDTNHERRNLKVRKEAENIDNSSCEEDNCGHIRKTPYLGLPKDRSCLCDNSHHRTPECEARGVSRGS